MSLKRYMQFKALSGYKIILGIIIILCLYFKVLKICDNHVSLYQLTVERGTPFHKAVSTGKLVSLSKTGPLQNDCKNSGFAQVMEILESHGI